MALAIGPPEWHRASGSVTFRGSNRVTVEPPRTSPEFPNARRTVVAWPRRGNTKPSRRSGGPSGTDGCLRGRADRDELPPSGMGRAGTSAVVGRGDRRGSRGPGDGEHQPRPGGRDRPGLHGLHGRGLRSRRQLATPGLALDGPAVVARGRRPVGDRRPVASLRLGAALSRVDVAEGAVAETERAGDVRAGRADR